MLGIDIPQRALEGGSSRIETAFVTGATSGIGRATALRLAKRGAAIGIVGRNAEAAEKVAQEIQRTGGEAMVLKADVMDSAQVAAATERFLKTFDRIDTVVSNAGIFITGTVTDTSEADWSRIIATNLTGTFHVARHTIPHMVSRGRGSFVAVSSDAGSWGSQGTVAYTASKHGLNGMIRCMALDLGPKGVRCNAVAPGWVETPMTERAFAGMSAQEIDHWRKSVPLGRFAKAEDVADVIAFLSSTEGAYANGMVYALDGGSTAGYFYPT